METQILQTFLQHSFTDAIRSNFHVHLYYCMFEDLSAFAQRDTTDSRQRVKLPFQGGRCNAILGAILVNSPFGRTIASARDFATPAIRLQVGLYRLCELRKVHMGSHEIDTLWRDDQKR